MERTTTTGMTREEKHLVDDAITKFIKRNIAEIEFWLAVLGLQVRDPTISAEEFQTIHRVAGELDATLDEYGKMGYPRSAAKPQADFLSPHREVVEVEGLRPEIKNRNCPARARIRRNDHHNSGQLVGRGRLQRNEQRKIGAIDGRRSC
jgi:hypothetical protein